MASNRYSVPARYSGNGHISESDDAHEPQDSLSRHVPPDQLRPIALSIISNSQLLCEGLTALLARYVKFDLIGTYRGHPPAEAECLHPAQHVVLLDGGMEHHVAMAWTRYWRGRTPPAAVFVLELADNVDRILEYIESGASGYTLQGASITDVVTLIYDGRCGRAHCSPEVTAQLFARVAALTPPMLMPLTRREVEILRCIAEDLSNKEIAERLVIDIRTVKHHVHNILDKLHLHHRWDAARVARERGWLDVDQK